MTDRPEEDAPVEATEDFDDGGVDALEPSADAVDEPGYDEPAVDQAEGEDLMAASAGDDPAAAEVASGGLTGHPAVDEVLRSLDGLDARPVDEHVAAFEHAHEVLRRALSDAGDDPVSREG